MQYAYYYSLLDKQQKEVYDAMTSCFSKIEPTVRVKYIGDKELYNVFLLLRLDHPRIFYVPSFSIRRYPGSEFAELVPEYLFEKSKIKEHMRAIDARLTRIVRGIKGNTKQAYDVLIHDFILENVKYDKQKKPYSHEIIGPLTQGVGVCEGIAKTVKLLCDELSIECIIPICDADPENGNIYRHTWNIIRCGGDYCHIDATYDNTLSTCGIKRYDYFKLCDKSIFRDHRPPMFQVPICSNSSIFYYKANRLSLTKVQDVKNMTAMALKKKRASCIFHWRGGYLTREILAQLLSSAAAAAGAYEKYCMASVNFPQAVIMLKFSDFADSEHIITEYADIESPQSM